MRVVALLATYNEERFVGDCIGHLAENDVETYLIDNGSEDGTVDVAERFRGQGLAGVEIVPRDGVYSWKPLLDRKAELATTLEADWFIHLDADEIRLPPIGFKTLRSALVEVTAEGFNAVNFQEFTFVPTVEEPNHDHPRYRETMRHYYPFLPRPLDRLNAWKRQETPVDLSSTGGHRVSFPGLRVCPQAFPMRHYLFLSVEHATRKFVDRAYDQAELDAGMHRRRASLRRNSITLLSQRQLRYAASDADLDETDPWTSHPLFSAPSRD